MKLRLLTVILFVVCWLSFSHASTNVCETVFSPIPKIRRSANLTRPTLEQLGNNLPAIHATNFIADDGVLRPTGRFSLEAPMDSKFRATVHFALGGMVPPHGQGSWEEYKMAVVLPFKHLVPRLRNAFSYDSYLLGSFKLPAGSTVLVPEGMSIDLPEGIQIIRYDSSQMQLREAVTDFLDKSSYWQVRMASNHGGSKSDPADFNGINVNNGDFFSDLLERRPDIHHAPAWRDPLTSIDAFMNQFLPALKDRSIPDARTLQVLATGVRRRLSQLKEDENLRILMTHSPETRSIVAENIKLARKLLRIISLETQLQRRFKRSILESNPSVYSAVMNRLFSEPGPTSAQAVLKDYPELAVASQQRPLNLIAILQSPIMHGYELSDYLADFHVPGSILSSTELQQLDYFFGKTTLAALEPDSTKYVDVMRFFLKTAQSTPNLRKSAFTAVKSALFKHLEKDPALAPEVAALLNDPSLIEFVGQDREEFNYHPPYSAKELR